MSLYYAYGSREIGGWCTPKVTLASPEAILRSCHVQSARFAEVLVTDEDACVVAHARGVLSKGVAKEQRKISDGVSNILIEWSF